MVHAIYAGLARMHQAGVSTVKTLHCQPHDHMTEHIALRWRADSQLPYTASQQSSMGPARTTIQDQPCYFQDVGGPSALEIYPVTLALGVAYGQDPGAGD